MRLEVLRYRSTKDETLSIVFDVSDGREFLCYGLEDEYRTKKVYGETRIPAGTYRMELRKEGGFHERYAKKFPAFHVGMLHVAGIIGFTLVLWHIGNTDEDTAGCLLLGSEPTEQGTITHSTKAYKRVYQHVAEAMEKGEGVTVEYIDYDAV